MRQERSVYIKTVETVVRVQAHVRSMISQARYQQIRKATCILQASARMCIVRNDYLRKRSAVIVLQTHVRRSIAQKRFLKVKLAIVLKLGLDNVS